MIARFLKPKLFLLRAAVPFVSILLLLAGIIQLRGQFWVPGTVCLVLAMAGILYSMRFLEKPPFSQEELDILRPLVVPAILWTVILGLLTLSVYYVADNTLSRETDEIASMAWITSVLLGLIVTWGAHQQHSLVISLLKKINANRKEVFVLLLVLGLALAMRTIYLSSHPYPWSGDELSIGIEGDRILNGEVTNYFDTGWSIQTNWSFMPTAFMEMILGRNILAIRLPSAIIGSLAVLFLYLAARELFGTTVALLSSAFLATFPYQVHFSRVGVNNVVDSLMSCLVFWLIARGINTNDSRYYYAAGAAAGLSLYTYAGTRLVLILAAVLFLFLILRQKSYLAAHWRHLFSFGAAALVSMAPQAAFFARHPNSFMGRFGQEGIFLNGWLLHQSASTGKSILEILFNQFTQTILVFVATPAYSNFFNSPYPYLTVLGSVLFLLGMAYTLAYMLEWRSFMLLLWFWAVIFFGGVLTMSPPAHTRLLATAPVVCLMMALGLYKIVEYIQKFNIVPKRIIVPVLVAIVCVITFQNVQFYMFEYRDNYYFKDANGEFAMEAGLMAKSMGPDLQMYILGAPRIFAGFPTLVFLAPNNPRSDLRAENIDSLVIDAHREVGFFAIPENQALLDEIVQKYPGGEYGRVHRKPKPDEILFDYYIIKQ